MLRHHYALLNNPEEHIFHLQIVHRRKIWEYTVAVAVRNKWDFKFDMLHIADRFHYNKQLYKVWPIV